MVWWPVNFDLNYIFSGAINDTRMISKYSDLQLLQKEVTNDTIFDKILESRGKNLGHKIILLTFEVWVSLNLDHSMNIFTKSGVSIESVLAYQVNILKTWFVSQTIEKKPRKRNAAGRKTKSSKKKKNWSFSKYLHRAMIWKSWLNS